MATQEQAFAIEHLTLVYEDLTSEQEDSVLKVLGYVAELEAQVKTLQEAAQWKPVAISENVNDAIDKSMYIGIASGGHRFIVSLPQADDDIIVDLPQDYTICRRVTSDEAQTDTQRRIAELGATIGERDKLIGKLSEQLQAVQWTPLENRKTIGDERWPQTVWLVIQEHGFSFCTPYSTDHIRLPEGYALCRKVQP